MRHPDTQQELSLRQWDTWAQAVNSTALTLTAASEARCALFRHTHLPAQCSHTLMKHTQAHTSRTSRTCVCTGKSSAIVNASGQHTSPNTSSQVLSSADSYKVFSQRQVERHSPAELRTTCTVHNLTSLVCQATMVPGVQGKQHTRYVACRCG